MAATITLDRSEYRIDGKRRPASKFDRAAIMRRAHVLKHELRAATALNTFKAETRLDAMKRPWHPRSLAEITAATKLDFSAAMRAAWAEAHVAEAKRQRREARKAGRAVALANGGALAIIGAKLHTTELVALLSSVAAWVGSRFMPEARTGAALPILTHKRAQ